MSGIDVARAMGAAFGPGPDQVLYGTVASIATVAPNTVDVYLGNSTAGVSPSAATGLPYLSGYNPVVGDAVCVLHGQGSSKTSYLVLGTVAGASSGGGSAGVPIGAIQMFPVTITYPNWLLCNGGTFSSATYPALYALLGSTTLPNLQGVAPMGAGANGITLGTRDASGHLIAHTHTGPSHTHTDSGHSHGHSHAPASGTGFVNVVASGASGIGAGVNITAESTTGTDSTNGTASLNNSGTGATGSTGSGSANVPPNYGVDYYIRAA